MDGRAVACYIDMTLGFIERKHRRSLEDFLMIRALCAVVLVLFSIPAYAGTDRVKMFIGDLRSDVGEVRAGAALALGEAGDPRAVDPLKRVLDDEFIDVRKAAAWALGELGDKSASSSLEKSLQKDGASQVRMAAAGALGKLRVTATAPTLKAALKDTDSGVRAQSVEALASVAGLGAVADATPLLRDENWSVRCSATNALGAVKSRESVAVLGSVLGVDDTDYVRAGAAHALGKIGDKAAIPALQKALKDPSAKVRGEAAASLLALGYSSEDPDFNPVVDPPETSHTKDVGAVEL